MSEECRLQKPPRGLRSRDPEWAIHETQTRVKAKIVIRRRVEIVSTSHLSPPRQTGIPLGSKEYINCNGSFILASPLSFDRSSLLPASHPRTSFVLCTESRAGNVATQLLIPLSWKQQRFFHSFTTAPSLRPVRSPPLRRNSSRISRLKSYKSGRTFQLILFKPLPKQHTFLGNPRSSRTSVIIGFFPNLRRHLAQDAYS